MAGRTVISHEPIYRFVYHRSDDHPLHRKATMTAQRLKRRLRDLPQDLRRTISFDNVLCREAAAGFGQQISMRRQPSARHAI